MLLFPSFEVDLCRRSRHPSSIIMCIGGVSSLQIAAACFLLVCSTLAIARRGRSKRHFGLPLPPGPPGEFILGHLRSIPKSDTALAYAKWGREYSWFGGTPTPFPRLTVKSTGSDVIYLESLGQPIVVLNSMEAAAELLSRRAANYSDRPRFTLFEVYAPIPPLSRPSPCSDFDPIRSTGYVNNPAQNQAWGGARH